MEREFFPTFPKSIVDGLANECRAPDSGKLIRSLPSVVEYARRIHNEYFPDYDSPAWE